MDHNDVRLRGKLSGKPEHRPMPSGDTQTSWRLVIRRAQPRPGATVDTIRCVTYQPEITAFVDGLGSGDRMEVEGELRCRVYGPSYAKIWRYEVEVASVSAAPPPQDALPFSPVVAEEVSVP
ncbi:single-stranded DNA-binding protein [Nonomuraea typhae]|uniref:single-stranded DNA-binding protein n=1 Tax=Nonomuraea typhae TaxID=2603600 RepID=UPI0012F76FD3|nr:single-stranded DNA-binding protein [Nonomuraea typhae]